MKNQITLYELTGQESGVVIYNNGNTIICNWYGFRRLPTVLSSMGWLMDDMSDTIISVVSTGETDDASEYLCDVIYDFNDDAEGLINYPARFWELEDGTVILAPEDWC